MSPLPLPTFLASSFRSNSLPNAMSISIPHILKNALKDYQNIPNFNTTTTASTSPTSTLLAFNNEMPQAITHHSLVTKRALSHFYHLGNGIKNALHRNFNTTKSHLNGTKEGSVNTDIWVTFAVLLGMMMLVLVFHLGIWMGRRLQRSEDGCGEVRRGEDVEGGLGEKVVRLEVEEKMDMCVPCQKREESKRVLREEKDGSVVVVEEVLHKEEERMVFQTEEREEDRGVYTMWPDGPWRG